MPTAVWVRGRLLLAATGRCSTRRLCRNRRFELQHASGRSSEPFSHTWLAPTRSDPRTRAAVTVVFQGQRVPVMHVGK